MTLSRLPHRLALLALALALATACSITKPRTQQPTLQNASVEPVDVDAYADQYGEHEAVWLKHFTTIENTATKGSDRKWSLFRFVERRYVLLDPEADDLTTIEITVDEGETLSMVDLKTVNPDGTTQSFGRADLNTEPADGGGTTYKLAYPDVKKGTVIQEVFEIEQNVLKEIFRSKQTPPLYFDRGLQLSQPAESLRFAFSLPNWWKVDTKDVNPKERGSLLDVERNPETKEMRLTYAASDVPAVEDEPFSPFYKEMAKYATIEIQDFSLGGTFVYRAPQTWPDVAASLDDAAIDKDPLFSTAVRKMSRSIAEGGTTTEEKVKAILRYVYDAIEVNSNAEADDFEEVLEDGEGSIYLVTGLTQAMLAEVDVEADYLFVHSAQRGYFDRGFVTPREVRMPALRVEFGPDDTRYLFPFLNQLPTNVIPEPYQGQPALVVNRDGDYGGFTEIPRTSASQNVTDDNYELTIREDGSIAVVEEKVMRGSRAYVTRQSLLDLTDEERTEQLREELTYTDGDVEWTAQEVANLKDFSKPLRLRLEYTIDNLVTVTPEEVLFQTSGLFSPLSGTTYKVDTDERTNPIRINYTQTRRKHVEITYPDAWSLTTDLSDVSFENRFGSISGTYETQSGSNGTRTLVADQEVTLQRSQDDSEGMSDLVQLIGSQSDLQIPTLVFGVGSDARR